jgi:hypothetical protein
MAEELVLANLVINANGMVTSLAEGDVALQRSGQNLQEFGKQADASATLGGKLEERFFSLRHAAAALLGGFTLAGVIAEMTSLTAEIVKSTDAWKEASEAAGNYWKKIVDGETAAQAQLRHTADILKAAGVAGGMGSMSEQVKGIVEAKQNVMQLLFGDQEMTSAERAGKKTLAEFEVDSLNRALIELQKQSGLSLAAFEKLFKVDLGQGTRAIRVPEDQGGTPKNAKPGTDTPRGAFPALRLPDTGSFDAQFAEFPNTLRPFANELDEVDQKVIALTESAKNWKAQGASAMAKSWQSLVSGLKPVNEELLQAKEHIKKLTAEMKLMQEVSQAATEATTAAVSAGVISQAAAARVQEALQSALAYQQGLIAIANGGMALAAGDYGQAALYDVAAGLYFAAAAFHGIAAIHPATTAGGGAGRYSPLAAQAGIAPGGGSPAPNVTVIVQGSMIGTSKEELQRWVIDAWQKGARDQGGGDAVVASATPW